MLLVHSLRRFQNCFATIRRGGIDLNGRRLRLASSLDFDAVNDARFSFLNAHGLSHLREQLHVNRRFTRMVVHD